MRPEYKLRVHNLFEAKALLKEAIERGEEVDGLRIFNHAGEYIGTQCGDFAPEIQFDAKDDHTRAVFVVSQ